MAKKSKASRGKKVNFLIDPVADEAHAKSLAFVNDWLGKAAEKITNSPHADGWKRLCEILAEAKEDKRVMSSAGASQFVDLMLLLAEDSLTASSADVAIAPLGPGFQSSNSSEMAKKRFETIKNAEKWLVSEWQRDKSQYESKSDFARIYIELIRHKYGKTVTVRTILERWLKWL